ncbi:MAG: hypothetical protein ABI692_14800, partial [Terracoccus sp.]
EGVAAGLPEEHPGGAVDELGSGRHELSFAARGLDGILTGEIYVVTPTPATPAQTTDARESRVAVEAPWRCAAPIEPRATK